MCAFKDQFFVFFYYRIRIQTFLYLLLILCVRVYCWELHIRQQTLLLILLYLGDMWIPCILYFRTKKVLRKMSFRVLESLDYCNIFAITTLQFFKRRVDLKEELIMEIASLLMIFSVILLYAYEQIIKYEWISSSILSSSSSSAIHNHSFIYIAHKTAFSKL